MTLLTRRDAIALAGGTVLAAVATQRVAAQARGDVSPFSTSKEMLDALRAKRISAVELYDLHVARIERFDGKLNSIVIETFERGRREAAAADRRIAAGERSALLGLPMTLKESEQVAALPQTAGIDALRDYRPDSDGEIARRVSQAGAALLGKTNIPVALGDWQANSPIYGRTSNPWNLEHTSGGSTGGGSAAVAAGLTPLEGTVGQPAEQRAAQAAALRDLGPSAAPSADGLTLDFSALALLLERRAELQRVWADFFREFDVLLAPAFATTAFPHRGDPLQQRTIAIDGRTVPYLQLVFYPHIAIFCGLPATAFPAGFDGENLPIGLQAVGPYLEDRTPLRFAQLLEREWNAFKPPPGYA